MHFQFMKRMLLISLFSTVFLSNYRVSIVSRLNEKQQVSIIHRLTASVIVFVVKYILILYKTLTENVSPWLYIEESYRDEEKINTNKGWVLKKTASSSYILQFIAKETILKCSALKQVLGNNVIIYAILCNFHIGM